MSQKRQKVNEEDWQNENRVQIIFIETPDNTLNWCDYTFNDTEEKLILTFPLNYYKMKILYIHTFIWNGFLSQLNEQGSVFMQNSNKH